jgi:hypothetical protein
VTKSVLKSVGLLVSAMAGCGFVFRLYADSGLFQAIMGWHIEPFWIGVMALVAHVGFHWFTGRGLLHWVGYGLAAVDAALCCVLEFLFVGGTAMLLVDLPKRVKDRLGE